MLDRLRRLDLAGAILLGILAVSVGLRFLAALVMGDQVEILPGIFDQISYHTLANRLLDGYGFTFDTSWWPVTQAGQPTAHWSYLYTFYLTACYALFGDHPLVARLTQAVAAGILMPWLAYRLASRTFTGLQLRPEHSGESPRRRFAGLGGLYRLLEQPAQAVGLLAAAWLAVYGYLVYYAAALMTETFYILSILWTLDCALRIGAGARQGSSIPVRRWLELGLAIGVTALLRQVFLPFVPFLFLWLVWVFYRQRRRSQAAAGKALGSAAGQALKGGLLAGLVVIVLIAPFTLINYHQFGRFVLLNTNAGYAFFWSNHPIYGSHYSPLLTQEMGTYDELIPTELRSLDEAALDQALLRLGLGFILADPGRYLMLSLSRIPAYFVFWPTGGSSLISNLNRLISFTLAFPFMLAGTVIWLLDVRRRRLESEPGALLLLFALVYTLIHLLSWASIRYRLPVDAVLLVFAARALYGLVDRSAYPK
jgi:hypothetical protein